MSATLIVREACSLNPTVLASNFDSDYIRRGIRETLEITKGCVLEIIMKDVHTVNNKPERITKWVEIALETVNEFSQSK